MLPRFKMDVLELLPDEAVHHDPVSRLSTMAILFPETEDDGGGPRRDIGGFALDSPAWIVSILTDDVRVELTQLGGHHNAGCGADHCRNPSSE